MSVTRYLTRRAQALREQRFGESLRDQLGRRIAQLDYEATQGSRRAGLLLAAIFVATAAFLLAAIRVNMEPNEPFGGSVRIVRLILVFAVMWVASLWWTRRLVERDVLPRKRRLEALLKELDGQ